MPVGPRIAVAGAGSIGCFVGGLLAAAGRDVALLARPRIRDEIAAHGLRLTCFDGPDRLCSPESIAVSGDPAVALQHARLVLLAVKCADTAAMAALVARHAPADALVVSLQNGVGNFAVLAAQLGADRVLAAMVPFNVVPMGGGRFHRATSGDIVIARDGADTASALSVPGLRFVPSDRDRGGAVGKIARQS